VPQNVRMPVPQIGLLEAFAIGIPVGIAGFAVQETIIRRRLARSPGERAAPRKTEFGPREAPQNEPGEAAPEAADVTPPPPVLVTKPSRTRPKRAVETPAPVAALTSPAKALGGSSRKAATAPKPAATLKPAAAAKPAVAPKPAADAKRALAATPAVPPKAVAAVKAAVAPKPAAVARPAAVAAKPAPVKGPPKPLLKRETSLDAALDAVVDFVDGAPRKARAEACAGQLSRLLPKATRGPALTAFLTSTSSGTAPGELQVMAEAVGVELARELQSVRQEISSLS
jgi:hypothetical protein